MTDDIIITKNNIQFHLRELAVAEVENARVSLTELARLLGYQHKHKLHELALRHTKELTELAGNMPTPTVGVSSQGQGQR